MGALAVASLKWTKWEEEEKHDPLGYRVGLCCLALCGGVRGSANKTDPSVLVVSLKLSQDPSPRLTSTEVKMMTFFINSYLNFV